MHDDYNGTIYIPLQVMTIGNVSVMWYLIIYTVLTIYKMGNRAFTI